MRDVAIVAAGADTRPIDRMAARAIFICHPLHRMAGAAAEFVGSGRGDHDLSANDSGRPDDEAQDDKRQHGPARTRRPESAPCASLAC